MAWRFLKAPKGRETYPGFDAKFYLQKYPDVRSAGINPLDHYLTKGWKEGRDPNRYFSTSGYLRANADVHELGCDPLAHFLERGLIEGRGGWRRDGSASVTPTADDQILRREPPDPAAASAVTSVAASQQFAPPDDLRAAIAAIYRLALHRDAASEELDIWAGNIVRGETLANAIVLLTTCDEAKGVIDAARILPELSDGEFVQYVYETILDRGAAAPEIEIWQSHLATTLSRDQLLRDLFQQAARSKQTPQVANDPSRTALLGSDIVITKDDWTERRSDKVRRPMRSVEAPALFKLGRHDDGPTVSAIASLYNGDRYIEHFMEMIVGQSIFEQHTELIIIDAQSPGDEARVIERYAARFPNIRYIRTAERIGIYAAWNLGVREARGQYITNVNLDDVRKNDSLEVQAATLDCLSFVDVVYQDVYYTFEENLPFEEIAAAGFLSDLPVITPYNLLAFNSPHNGPMWRKRLHDDIGLFDESFKSAGDFEFWLRCAKHKKCFFKVPTPTVAYYVNPEGISTSAETAGVLEANAITQRHARALVRDGLTCDTNTFMKRVHSVAPELVTSSDRRPGWRYRLCQDALRSLETSG